MIKQPHRLPLLIVLFLASIPNSCTEEVKQIILTIRNELPREVEIRWEGPNDNRHSHGNLPPGKRLLLNSIPGHRFVYDYGGEEKEIIASEEETEVVLRDEAMIDDQMMAFTLRNELPTTIQIDWEAADGKSHSHGLLRYGKEMEISTFAGHHFTYGYDGKKFRITATKERDYQVLLGHLEDISVQCDTLITRNQTVDSVTIKVKPSWSPRGAARFLDLVRKGYYDGVALNRVVPQFLTQFGISPNKELRNEMKEDRIKDDPPVGVDFEAGMISYAGNGRNSRTTEVFIVMPGVSVDQLNHFGTNSWETPFGIVDNVGGTVVGRFYSYGDMPPWGNGPQSEKIYEDGGYEYLKREFPMMDYINKCTIVQSSLKLKDDNHGEDL